MEPLFTTVEQVSFMVRDMDEAVKCFADYYGIGPWTIVNFGHIDGDEEYNRTAVKIEDTVLEGKYVGVYAVRIGACTLPGLQIELIQPLDDKSLFSKYIMENGPGGQHIAVDNTVSFANLMGIMAEGGYPLAQLAKIDDIEDCAFVDHMRTLGTYIELHQRPDDFTFPDVPVRMYPEDGVMKKEPIFTDIDHLAFAVEDIDEAVKLFADRYGIGPWSMAEFATCEESGGDVVSFNDVKLDGKEVGPVRIKAAICDSLSIKIELMQSVGGNDCVGRFVKEFGPGVHHICLTLGKDFDDAMAAFEASGHAMGQSSVVDNQEFCVFSDHRDLFGTYFEIQKRGEDFTLPNITPKIYPPKEG